VTSVTSVASLAAELEPALSPEGVPARPLVIIPLERWRDAPPAAIADAARLVAEALPVTACVLEGPPSRALAPLIEAATLTLAADASERAVVPAGDLGCDLDEAVARLRAAVARSPRAAVACGHLVRQTAALAPRPGTGTTAALAAEAAAYSLLLGGTEFARWLAERGTARRRRPPPEPVRVTRRGGNLSIMLDDPGRRNALSARMREALLDAVLLAEADDTIESVELRGAGPAFCAGGDLDEFGTAKDLVAAYMVRLARAPWQVIDRIAPKVTVYAHGACVGAGAEITAYAGRVVAAPDAFFALPEVRMGLVPGAGGSVSVPRRIGRWRAAWLMLTGDRLPAAAALRWGLADDISGPAGPVPGSLPGRCLREGPEHGDQRAGVLGGASPVSRPDAACGTVRNSVPSCWYRIPIGAVP
jgi:enoyl-CoA hydratase/carnithine racemase